MRSLDRWGIRALFLVLFALLGGCGGPAGLVRPNEPTRVTRIFTVTTPIEWARYKGYDVELWTIDGTALNRIVWLVNIRDKHHVFGSGRATKRRPDGAFYRNGMDASEIEAVLRDGLTGLGLINVKTTNLRPVKIGQFTAFRFELSFDVAACAAADLGDLEAVLADQDALLGI